MDTATTTRLRELNRAFYTCFAAEFAASRGHRLNPGTLRFLERARDAETILDLGCGDGRLLRAVLRGQCLPRLRFYRGVDFSSPALEKASGSPSPSDHLGQPGAAARLSRPPCAPDARSSSDEVTSMHWKQDPDPNEGAAAGDVPAQRADPPRPEGSRVVDGQFILADLVDEDWTTRPGLAGLRFAVVACLATLFHIPSRQKRRALLERAAAMAEPGGMVVISVWQFLHRERFQRRIVPWSTAGLSETEVEEGDLLLDWRAGGHGLRYVHHYAVGELDEDISGIGLRIVEDYRSDGDTGDLSRYLVLRRDSSPEDRGCGSSMPMTE